MTTKCHIVLCKQDEDQCYVDGDNITASITLVTTEDKNVKEINIRFHGRATVRFVPDNESHYVEDTDSFVDQSAKVYGNGILPAGTYNFKQSFSLPFDCLTSMESEFGHIRYEISLIIFNEDEPDNVFLRPISVVKTYNLQEHAEFNMPVQYGNLHRNCECNKENKCNYLLTIPFGAYTSGQVVELTFEGSNKRSEKVNLYTIRLIKKMKFSANVDGTRWVKTTETDLVTIEFQDNGREEQTFRNSVLIPSAPRTTYIGLICVEYYLVARAKLNKCSDNLNIEMPIVVGTEPLIDSLPPLQCMEDFRPDCYETACTGEVTFIDVSVDETKRRDDFLPVYPLFK